MGCCVGIGSDGDGDGAGGGGGERGGGGGGGACVTGGVVGIGWPVCCAAALDAMMSAASATAQKSVLFMYDVPSKLLGANARKAPRDTAESNNSCGEHARARLRI